MVTSATANSSHAESLTLSRSAGTPTGKISAVAVAAAQAAEAKQQAIIAAPVRLVRPRKTISMIIRTNAAAHPE